MSALFKISRHDDAVHIARDGQRFGTDMDARRHNAEIGMLKVLSRQRNSRVNDITFVRNLTRHASPEDVRALVAMLKAYLAKVKPMIMALPGPVGWVKENGRDVHYPIDLPWGDSADRREEGARMAMIELFAWMANETVGNYLGRDAAMDRVVAEMGLPTTKLSAQAARAICNANLVSPDPAVRDRDVSRFRYTRGFDDHTSATNDAGRLLPGQEERLLEALETAAQALSTPVEPR